MKKGIYIYGVIQATTPQEFGEIDLGNEVSRVETIGFKDIAAVISRSPFVAYDSLAKEQTIKDLVAHQFVIENVMDGFTIIPVKFGTMVEKEAEAIAFLEKGYTLLKEELLKMQGKIELDVVASWELPRIIPTLYHEDSRIQATQKNIASKGDKVSIEDKIALGKSIEQALKTKKASYNQSISQTLKQNTVDMCLHDLASDEMIFNGAFLLEKKNEASFNEVITTLNNDLENTVNFRVVGPIPAYSFSTILLEKIDPARYEEARKVLGLQGEVTEAKVRSAYHQMAQKSHPDKRGQEASGDFHLVHAAYKTLKKYVEDGSMHVEVYRWEKSLQ